MGAERKLFGTDGIRGRANIYPMTGEMAMALGRAATSYFQERYQTASPLLIIGKDTRLSCYMLEQAFASGVCSQGGRAILTGPLPTAGVAFVTQSMRADAGVMISASHNPYYDNGLKLFDRTGHKLPDSVEIELEKRVFKPELLEKKINYDLGRAKRLDEVMGRYIVHTKSALGPTCNLEGMRLVLDCANGAAYKLGPMIFDELGAEVISIGVSPNGRNINELCGALYPQHCAEQVRRYRADLGICLDGDADRLTLVDERGVIIHGDQLLGLMARFLQEKGEIGEGMVGTVMSNLGLEHYLNSLQIPFTRTKVGDRYIIEAMRRNGELLGGEPSGHLIFKKYSTTGDGILAALKVIECLQFFGKTLSELISDIPLFPQVLKNVPVSRKVPFDEVEGIQKELDRIHSKLGKNGRVLLRYSGTESLARVMIEGRDEAEIRGLCSQLVDVVTENLG